MEATISATVEACGLCNDDEFGRVATMFVSVLAVLSRIKHLIIELKNVATTSITRCTNLCRGSETPEKRPQPEGYCSDCGRGLYRQPCTRQPGVERVVYRRSSLAIERYPTRLRRARSY